MRYVYGVAFLTAFIALGSCLHAAPTITPATKCRPADDASQSLITHLRWMMTTRDELITFARDNYYHVPVVPPKRIRLVSDARTCDRAAAAYGAAGAGAATRRVYVVRLGSRGFAVLDPTHLAGEYRTVKIFDATWKPIGGWTGP